MKKLSTAMLEGADRRPQASLGFFRSRSFVITSCAMGAAYESVCGHPDDAHADLVSMASMAAVRGAFPNVDWDTITPNPAFVAVFPNEATPTQTLYDVIAQLNDHYHWTRERIATWLQGMGY